MLDSFSAENLKQALPTKPSHDLRVEDAILGILALLLRIQYVHGRIPFRCRKQLVLDEANAGQEPGKKTLSLTN